MDQLTHLANAEKIAVLGPKAGDIHPLVPEENGLDMPDQDFSQTFQDEDAPERLKDPQARIWRIVVFGATAALSGWCSWEMFSILSMQGLSILEAMMGFAFTLSFIWIALACVNAMIGTTTLLGGLLSSRWRTEAQGPTDHLDVALLLPTYNESPSMVLGNAVAMLQELGQAETKHQFSLYVLSDTTDYAVVVKEIQAIQAARRLLPDGTRLYYRRRDKNIGKKAGNIAEWCRRWGGRYDAMLTLDADSLMSSRAIISLSDALASDPTAGLVQSMPQIIKTQTLFARLQQFANTAYGPVLAAGLATWSRGEGNYWGHNAIIRTRVFAKCAGLPHLKGPGLMGGHILSHDFVEAALLRRAGWRVRMLPTREGSYEEAPPGLVDHVVRDRRWCQGNLQHLGLLMARGLHPVSRFHLLQGAMAYLSALLWFAFLAVGIAVASQAEVMPVNYFPDPYALFPIWPVLDSERAWTLLAWTIGVLLMPKALGILTTLILPPGAPSWGGALRFLAGAIIELILSAVLAPVMMIQQTIAIFRIVSGIDSGWKPQRRESEPLPFLDILRFHLTETVLGLGLTATLVMGWMPLLLSPIAISLLLAVPLSLLTQARVSWLVQRAGILATPADIQEPEIVTQATLHSQIIDHVLTKWPTTVEDAQDTVLSGSGPKAEAG
ncbi:glucans biosynthesis glucosyltransferase MdoH [Coralliovum pocilloporae]|uniref:glucans biosynthesis glucosyltransferase MdoH n=1 Tax=Coralliovum pocilloporae TaxID=3066369 RepID=UPI0033078B07